MTIEMVAALTAALGDYASDPEVRCAVITGAPPAFCAGLDLEEFAPANAPRHLVAELIRSLPQVSKPLIAAVTGAAYTGGLELALGCDFIIAGQSARFADTHARIGAMSASGLATRLSRAVGPRLAKQMMLTGAPIDADHALRAGLVNEVVADDGLVDRAMEVARQIAQIDTDLCTATKAMVDNGVAVSLDEALAGERQAFEHRRMNGRQAWQS